MDKRTQFTFYLSIYESICHIRKAADRAAAYDAICRYALLGEEPEMEKLPDAAAIVFVSARPNLDASRRKAAGGRAGGKAKDTAKIAEGYAKDSASIPQASAKDTAKIAQARGNAKREIEETASEKENEIEIEKEKEKEYECTPPTPSPKQNKHQASIQAVVGLYNELCPKLPKVSMISNLTRLSITDRLRDNPDMGTFRTVFSKANASSFLTGGNKSGWRANLDWLMGDTNFARVANGYYDDTKPARQEIPKGASGELGQAELEAIQQLLREEKATSDWRTG